MSWLRCRDENLCFGGLIKPLFSAYRNLKRCRYVDAKMNPEAKTTVALKSRQQAGDYSGVGNFGRAFAHYLVALTLKPEWKNELKTQFTTVLCAWGEELESQRRYSDLFKCYEQAVEIFPEHEEVLGNLGAHLFRLGHLREASHYFRQSLKLNCEYLPSYHNLQSVCNLLVERWHFHMLNDANRNEAYREAIMKKVKQGFNSVLDIGTGTGIFSVFAENAGAQRIYACDYSDTMCSIAEQVFEANCIKESVKLINKSSEDLKIPNDLEKRVSLVVTETMDAGLFGERLLQTLIHAWDKLLLPPYPDVSSVHELRGSHEARQYGIIIPFGATLWAVPIECNLIAKKFRFLNNNDRFKFSNINIYTKMSEPYDTESLQQIREYKFLSEPQKVFDVNFNNPQELKDFYNGKYDDNKIRFNCPTENIDAVAVWFELRLDEDIRLSSSPHHIDAKTCCWDQAVFPVNKQNAGCEITIKIKSKKGQLGVEVCEIEKSLNRTEGKSASEENLSELFQTRLSESTDLLVSQSLIEFMNNRTMMQVLDSVATELSKREHKFVLDLSNFPFVGLKLLQSCGQSLVCVVKDNNDIVAIKRISSLNNINIKAIKFILESSLEKYLEMCKIKFNIIVTNIVESTGELKEKHIALLPVLRQLLKEDGIMIPQRVSLWCKLIESPWLTRSSKVVNEELIEKYKIASFINVYQVPHHLDINLNKLEFKTISDPTECFRFTTEEFSENQKICEDVRLTVHNDGSVNAIPYWFRFEMLENSGLYVSTLCEDSHINTAVALVDSELSVKTDETVLIRVFCQYGVVRIVIA